MSPSLALREEISFKKRKRVAKIALTAILVCVFLAVFLSVAQAAPDSVSSSSNGSNDGSFHVPSTFSEDLLSDDDILQLVGSFTVTKTFTTIDGILGSNFYYVAVERADSPGKKISNAIVGLALAFSLIYGFIHAFQIFARGELNLDMGVKIAMTFVLSFLFVIYCNDIANVIDRLGLGIVSFVRDQLYVEEVEEEVNTPEQADAKAKQESDTIIKIGQAMYSVLNPGKTIEAHFVVKTANKLLNTLKERFDNTKIDNVTEDVENVIDYADPLTGMRSVIISLFLQIINQLLLYGIAAAAFGLYISFTLRRAFLPVAVAEVTSEGLRSPGVQYIKIYFSLYLEFAYFYIIAATANLMETFAYNSVSDSRATNTILGVVGALLCIRAAVMASLRKSSDFAKSVVGVH